MVKIVLFEIGDCPNPNSLPNNIIPSGGGHPTNSVAKQPSQSQARVVNHPALDLTTSSHPPSPTPNMSGIETSNAISNKPAENLTFQLVLCGKRLIDRKIKC